MSTATPTLAPSPFMQAWERADNIDGWLTRFEAELLFKTAAALPEGSFILEIGSYRGKSTSLLASTGHEMVAIDPLSIGDKINARKAVCEDDVESLIAVAKENDNLNWVRYDSTQIDPDVFPLIDLLYIDGNHTGNAAYDDFTHFKKRLKHGASVAFHDFDTSPDVTQCVKRLEAEGYLKFSEQAGSMYVGRFRTAEPVRENAIRVFLAMPHCHDVVTEANQSFGACLLGHSGITADARQKPFSILTSNFNKLTVACLNADYYDFFCIQHSDISLPAGWLGKMVRTMDRHGADVLHAVSPIKGDTGETSTAVAYSGDRWTPPRKLTQYEIHQLPVVFDVRDCQRVIDPKIQRLLCNTGVLCIRIGEWFKDFPGFGNMDRIVRVGPKCWKENTVPEDWNFGHWCADSGINVWGTRDPVVGHWGRLKFSSDQIWGHKVDPAWAAANGVT